MQPDVLTRLFEVVLSLGFPGVVLVVLALTIRGLWDDNKTLRQQLFDLAVKNAASVEANTAALNRISDNLVKGNQLQ